MSKELHADRAPTRLDMAIIMRNNGKMSDQAIAEILLIDPLTVSNFIKHTTGKPNAFQPKIKKPPKEKKRSHKVKLRKPEEPKREKPSKVTTEWARQRNESAKRESRRTCETVVRDYSKMQRVIINSRTSIYINKGEDPIAAAAKYRKRMEQKTDYRNMAKD